MRTSFLFLAAFIAVAAAQASSTPNVESGLSGGLRMEFEAAMNQSNALMMALPDPFANWHKPLPDGPHVTTCSDLPVLQNTCLGVYLQASDLSLSVWLSIKGASAFGHKVFAANISMTKVSASKFCLKDTDLLELIELIPVLLPFKIPIDKIIKELGKIPIHIFSVCAEAANNQVDTQKKTWTVDPKIINNLMCLGGHCLCSEKCSIDFGNHTIHY